MLVLVLRVTSTSVGVTSVIASSVSVLSVTVSVSNLVLVLPGSVSGVSVST